MPHSSAKRRNPTRPLPLFIGLSILLALTTSSSAAPAGPLTASSLFQQAPEYLSGTGQANQVVVADLNGDGIPDAVVVNGCLGCASGTVGVLLGIGGGAFQPAVIYNTGGTSPTGVAVGDVNGDGKPDIVVANGGSNPPPPGGPFVVSNTVAVLLGNGDGTFRPAVTYSAGVPVGTFIYSTGGMALADVNGDGKLDVVVMTFTDNAGAAGSAGFSVLLGRGDGTFESAVNYNIGATASSLVVSDLNGDGKPDLVFPIPCTQIIDGICTAGGVGILFGNGDGTFQPLVTLVAAGETNSVAVGDVNGDGKPDIVADSGGVQLFLGNGNGTFQAAVTVTSPIQGTSTFISLADVNGDGKLDILEVDAFVSGALLVMLGNGNGTFQSARAFSSVGWAPSSLTVADVNADGKPDVLITNQCASSQNNDPLVCTSGSMAVLLGNGDGTFRSGSNYNAIAPSPPNNPTTGAPYNTAGVATGDLNGDGKADLVVAYPCVRANSLTNFCEGAVDVLLNNGNGTFGAPVPTSFVAAATAVAIADVNGDGKPDLLVGSGCANPFFYCQQNNGPTGSVYVAVGKGDGTFASGTTYQTGGIVVTSIAVADVNGDGKPDLLVANPCVDANCANGVISVLLGNGDGTFQQAVNYNSGGLEAESVAVSDVNGDGHPDLIVANSGCKESGPTCIFQAGVSVLLGNGDGTFQPAVTYATGGLVPVTVVVGDINGDGKPDLVVGNSGCTAAPCSNASVAVLLGNGNGTFQTPLTTAVPAIGYSEPEVGGGSLALADFNGDGKLDVAGASQGFADFVLLGNGDGTFQPSVNLGAAAAGVVAADLTGQGKPSLVFGGALTVLLHNESTSTTSLSSSLNPSTAGQQVTFTAVVSAQSGPTPTGSVTFAINGKNPAIVPLTNGQASFQSTLGNAGSSSVTADYSGDATYAPSSAVLSQSVIQPIETLLGSPQQPLSKDGSGNFLAKLTITNTGDVTVSSLQVTVAGTTLGSGGLLAAPAAITNLAPKQSAMVTLAFPSSAVSPPATTASLQVSATYTVTNPLLNGNVVFAATVAVVPVSVAGESTTVHYLGVGSSAMWQGFGIAAYNDLAVNGLCKGGVIQAGFASSSAVAGNACTVSHWTVRTAPRLAAAKDTRSPSIPIPLEYGSLWVVWVTDTVTGVDTDVWAYLSVDSAVGVRNYLANPRGLLVVNAATETTAGAGVIASNFFVDGSADNEVGVPADVWAAISGTAGVTFTAGMTDIRPEDAKLATERTLGTVPGPYGWDTVPSLANDFIYSFSLGYIGSGPAGMSIKSGEIGTGALVWPVDFALPGANDPLSGNPVSNTIEVFPVGEAPIIFVTNRSNVTTGLGQLWTTATTACTGMGTPGCTSVVYPADGSYAYRNLWDQHPYPAQLNVFPNLNLPAAGYCSASGEGTAIAAGLCHGPRRPLGSLFAGFDCETDSSAFTWPLDPNTEGMRTSAPNGSAEPITVFLQDPLSGAYNTTEYAEVKIYGTPGGSQGGNGACPGAGCRYEATSYISQETNVDLAQVTANALIQQCPLKYVGPSDPADTAEGVRIRGIGTDEVLNGPTGAVDGTAGDGVLNTMDSIGYAFFSFGNVSELAFNKNYGYLMVDGIDPLFAKYDGTGGEPGQPVNWLSTGPTGWGELPACGGVGQPACTAAAIWGGTGASSFPHLRDGTYPAWSELRMMCDSADLLSVPARCTRAEDSLGAEALVANLQDDIHDNQVGGVPDLLPFSDDASFGPVPIAVGQPGYGDVGFIRSHYNAYYPNDIDNALGQGGIPWPRATPSSTRQGGNSPLTGSPLDPSNPIDFSLEACSGESPEGGIPNNGLGGPLTECGGDVGGFVYPIPPATSPTGNLQ